MDRNRGVLLWGEASAGSCSKYLCRPSRALLLVPMCCGKLMVAPSAPPSSDVSLFKVLESVPTPPRYHRAAPSHPHGVFSARYPFFVASMTSPLMSEPAGVFLPRRPIQHSVSQHPATMLRLTNDISESCDVFLKILTVMNHHNHALSA